MKKYITLSAIFALAVLAGQAQSPSPDSIKLKEIKTLFHQMQQDSLISKTMDAIYSSMSTRLIAQLKDSAISSDGAAMRQVNQAMEKMRHYSKEMIWRLLNEDMVAIYDKYFSLKEIDDLITFYRSPSGQAMLRKTPDITRDMMTVMYSKYIPEMQKMMTDDIQKISSEKTNAK